MKRMLALLSGIVVGALCGAVMGFFSIDAKAWIYGPLHSTTRYHEFGGAIQALIEGAYAAFAGALVMARLAWLMGGVVNRLSGGKRFPGDRPLLPDLVLLPIVFLWVYLIKASW